MAIKTTQYGKEGYWRSTPAKVKKLAMAIKGLCGAISGAAYFTDRPGLACAVMITGAVADEVIKFFYEE